MALTLAQIIEDKKLKQNENFAGSLLSQAIGAGGDYAYNRETEELSYSPGGQMPTKTEAWNNYMQMRGGKVSAQDIVAFNQLYTQAQTMQTQNQIQELSKLQMQGADTDDIRSLVGQNPQMYENLLDMITQLEGSPDETGQSTFLANQMRGFIPEKEKGYMEMAGDFAGDHWGKILAGGIGARVAWTQLQNPKVKNYMKAYLTDPNAKKAFDKLVDSGKWRVNDDGVFQERFQTKTKVLNANGKVRMKNGKPVYKTSTNWRTAGEGGLKYRQEATAKFKASTTTSPKNIIKYGSARNLLSMIGYTVAAPIAGEIGEAIGGEEGRQTGYDVAETGINVGLIAQGGKMLMKAPSPYAKLAGAGLLGLGGYGLASDDGEEAPISSQLTSSGKELKDWSVADIAEASGFLLPSQRNAITPSHPWT